MRTYIDKSALREGDEIHGRGQTFYAKAIRKVLSRGLPKGKECWGNHDAIIVRDPYTHELRIGESVPMFAMMTLISDYEKKINAGAYEIKVYRVKAAEVGDGCKAADYWVAHVNNTAYNFLGILKLLVKYLFSSALTRTAGWEWAHWCTQGVAESWKNGTGLDPWHKRSPTPYTTEKRAEEGVFEDITSQVVKQVQASPVVGLSGVLSPA